MRHFPHHHILPQVIPLIGIFSSSYLILWKPLYTFTRQKNLLRNHRRHQIKCLSSLWLQIGNFTFLLAEQRRFRCWQHKPKAGKNQLFWLSEKHNIYCPTSIHLSLDKTALSSCSSPSKSPVEVSLLMFTRVSLDRMAGL